MGDAADDDWKNDEGKKRNRSLVMLKIYDD